MCEAYLQCDVFPSLLTKSAGFWPKAKKMPVGGNCKG